MACALTEEPIVLDLCQKRGLRVLPGPIRPSDASQHVCDRRVRRVETLSRHPVCRRNRGHSAIEGRDDTSLAPSPGARGARELGALADFHNVERQRGQRFGHSLTCSKTQKNRRFTAYLRPR